MLIPQFQHKEKWLQMGLLSLSIYFIQQWPWNNALLLEVFLQLTHECKCFQLNLHINLYAVKSGVQRHVFNSTFPLYTFNYFTRVINWEENNYSYNLPAIDLMICMFNCSSRHACLLWCFWLLLKLTLEIKILITVGWQGPGWCSIQTMATTTPLFSWFLRFLFIHFK